MDRLVVRTVRADLAAERKVNIEVLAHSQRA
jgi:hypothetical protein